MRILKVKEALLEGFNSWCVAAKCKDFFFFNLTYNKHTQFLCNPINFVCMSGIVQH